MIFFTGKEGRGHGRNEFQDFVYQFEMGYLSLLVEK